MKKTNLPTVTAKINVQPPKTTEPGRREPLAKRGSIPDVHMTEEV